MTKYMKLLVLLIRQHLLSPPCFWYDLQIERVSIPQLVLFPLMEIVFQFAIVIYPR